MSDAPTQLTEKDLDGMSAEQIVTAREAGKLDALLGIGDQADPDPTPAHPYSVITEDDLKSMAPEEIVAAHRAGRLTHLLGATPPVAAGPNLGARGRPARGRAGGTGTT